MQDLDKLTGYDWMRAFECCGVETDEQRKHWDCDDYEYSVRYNEPHVNVVLGSIAVESEPFTRDDILDLIACEAGENDGPEWVAVMRLKDGRYAFLEAGCDYTGWDCQSGGNAFVADTLERLVQYGMSEGARARLAAQLEAA